VSAGNYTNLTVQGGNVTVAADLVTWSFDNTGNLTLPGNTFAVNYANGDPVTFGGSSDAISNGTSNVSIPTADGPILMFDGGVPVANITPSQIAIGGNAQGAGGSGANAIAIGALAGNLNQGQRSVALGQLAGSDTQGIFSVAIGRAAGQTTQGQQSVAIGSGAGTTSQGRQAVAIGDGAGGTTQSGNAIAIGRGAGASTQGIDAVAIGPASAGSNQGANAIAVGFTAGQTSQSVNAIAIGALAGSNTQSANAIAIGWGAGQGNAEASSSQGANSIAIGMLAGNSAQVANSIILNASGTDLPATNSGLYIDPVRNDTGNTTNVVYYNTTTKEVTYGPAPVSYGDSNVSTYLASGTNTGGFSSAGNITLGGTGSPVTLQDFSSTPTEVTLGWSPSISPAPFTTGDTVLVEGGSGVDGSWTVVSCDINGVTITCNLNPGSGFYTDLPGPTVSLVYISSVTASGDISGVNLIATGGISAGGTIASNGDITAVSGNVIAGEVQTPSLVVNGTSDLGAVANVTITGGTSGQILSTDGSGTLSWTSQSIVVNEVIEPGATITPTGTSTQYNATALSESATVAAPSGTPTDGQKLTIRILDNGAPQALTWNAVYEVIGTTLPTTTVASKYTYVGCIYNAQSSTWDVVSVAQQA
jgi:hypothetical protein